MKNSLRITVLLSSLSIVLAIVGLSFSHTTKADQSERRTTWQSLSTIVEADVLTDIVASNTAPSADRQTIADAALGAQHGDLLVIDFASPELCGRGGCAIAAYRISTNEQLLFTYVRRDADGKVVELVEREGVDLPCLAIAPSLNQTTSEGDKEVLCYRDSQWLLEGV